MHGIGSRPSKGMAWVTPFLLETHAACRHMWPWRRYVLSSASSCPRWMSEAHSTGASGSRPAAWCQFDHGVLNALSVISRVPEKAQTDR